MMRKLKYREKSNNEKTITVSSWNNRLTFLNVYKLHFNFSNLWYYGSYTYCWSTFWSFWKDYSLINTTSSNMICKKSNIRTKSLPNTYQGIHSAKIYELAEVEQLPIQGIYFTMAEQILRLHGLRSAMTKNLKWWYCDFNTFKPV